MNGDEKAQIGLQESALNMTPESEPGMPQPVLGRQVIYKSKIYNGPVNDVRSPAIVIRTRTSTVKAVMDRWGPEPRNVETGRGDVKIMRRPDGVVDQLEDDFHVDLVVFGLGRTYREYGVRYGDGRGDWNYYG